MKQGIWKKIYFVFVMVFCIFISCKTSKKITENTNSPEYVTEKFLFHLNRLEYDEAKQYGTESTEKMLNLIVSMVDLLPEQQTPQEVSAIINYCEINGNNAICYYTANNKEENIELVKIDGVWLVDLKKESFMPSKPKPPNIKKP